MCVLLYRFGSMYARYMSFKRTLPVTNFMPPAPTTSNVENFSFPRQMKKAYQGVRRLRITRKMQKLSRFEAYSYWSTEGNKRTAS